MKDSIHTTAEACNYAQLKLQWILLVFGCTQFKSQAKHWQFRLRLTVHLSSTCKKLKNSRLNSASYRFIIVK